MIFFARFATPDEVEEVLSGDTDLDYAFDEKGDILILTEDK